MTQESIFDPVFFRMRGICKSYRMGDEDMQVLTDVNLDIKEGEYLSVLGPSGSGKSTLMNIIGCLDVATKGEYILHGQAIEELDETQLARMRCHEIGFIFQNHQLLPRLTAQKNVELPLIYAGVGPRERRRRAKEILERVGLAERRHHYPNQLSGGQAQRVAIARALVGNPSILLADEPTGALDQKTGRQVMELFRELNEEGRTIIMITHDTNIAKYAQRIVHIIDGELTEGESLASTSDGRFEKSPSVPATRSGAGESEEEALASTSDGRFEKSPSVPATRSGAGESKGEALASTSDGRFEKSPSVPATRSGAGESEEEALASTSDGRFEKSPSVPATRSGAGESEGEALASTSDGRFEKSPSVPATRSGAGESEGGGTDA